MSHTTLVSASVFVVEDDEYMQNVLNQYLSYNYEVSVFNNGMDAMADLQSGNVPDIIITDLNTPVLNGFELLKQLKASGYFNSVPVIILSGEDTSDKRIKCLSAGADDYILKPFNPQELDVRIRMILKRFGKNIPATA